MRLILTLSDTVKAKSLSDYLTQNGVETQCDISRETAWGSDAYGETQCHLWIVDEDQIEVAKELVDQYERKEKKAAPLPSSPKAISRQLPGYGKMTLGITLFCTLLFLWTSWTTPQKTILPSYLPQEPFLTSPVTKALLFDYPESFSLIDQVVRSFGFTPLLHIEELPKQAFTLLEISLHTPYWKGFYEMIVDHFQKGASLWPIQTPLFEKIREGEIWRLWSPCFLHNDILHLFFNMAWLVLVGSLLEVKLGRLRFLLFILVTGPISNVSQYLVSGANFLGFSGVLASMLAFIWTRQKIAPWEGYRVDRSTFIFVGAFVLGMAGLQVGAFVAQIFFNSSFSLPIANTAHLAGAIIGFFIGKSRYFASLL